MASRMRRNCRVRWKEPRVSVTDGWKVMRMKLRKPSSSSSKLAMLSWPLTLPWK